MVRYTTLQHEQQLECNLSANLNNNDFARYDMEKHNTLQVGMSNSFKTMQCVTITQRIGKSLTTNCLLGIDESHVQQEKNHGRLFKKSTNSQIYKFWRHCLTVMKTEFSVSLSQFSLTLSTKAYNGTTVSNCFLLITAKTM